MAMGIDLNRATYFGCEKMHARIPISTCIARQVALVKNSRRLLFPECWNCQQGKMVRKGHPDMSAKDKGEPIMTDQTKAGSEQAGKKGKLCKECGERPPISDHSPFCASCMQKKAMQARAKKTDGDKAPGRAPKASEPKKVKAKRDESGDARPEPSYGRDPKNKETVLNINLEGYPEILAGIEKMAKEEIRPVESQVICILKRQMENLKVT